MTRTGKKEELFCLLCAGGAQKMRLKHYGMQKLRIPCTLKIRMKVFTMISVQRVPSFGWPCGPEDVLREVCREESWACSLQLIVLC